MATIVTMTAVARVTTNRASINAGTQTDNYRVPIDGQVRDVDNDNTDRRETFNFKL